MQIIDPHHHLWDLENNSYPWLVEPVDHFVGDYSPIRRSYLVQDFLSDASGYDLVKSVHVQAEFDHNDDPVKETAWLQSVSDDPASRGFPHGCVAFTDLASPGVEDVLARHCEYPIMRGVRQMLNFAAEPHLRFAERGDLLNDEQWRSGYRLLAKHGLSFDMQVWPWQLRDGAQLALDIPEVPVILNHTGMPIHQDPLGMKVWREGMRELAEAPNTSVKISALGMMDRNWTADSIRPLVLETIDIFGVDRCMFASNFPVDSLMSDYGTLCNAFDEITAGFSEGERRRLFHDNAQRYYRLD
ncbi:MAG: amidohydrolase family protein [Dehalococcoidia bacterium]